MRTRNCPTGIQKHKINVWLEANKETAVLTPNFALAKAATKDLAFEVTETNIAYARRCLEIPREFKKRKPRIGRDSHDNISIVALSLLRLKKTLGEQIEPQLQAIAYKQSMKSLPVLDATADIQFFAKP